MPNVGASIMRPPPDAMATWWAPPAPTEPPQNRRVPGLFADPGVEFAWNVDAVCRGTLYPSLRSAQTMSPEQSTPPGTLTPPHT